MLLSKEASQIANAASTLGQGKRDTTSLFSKFPNEILIKIARETTDATLPEDDANTVARVAMRHPADPVNKIKYENVESYKLSEEDIKEKIDPTKGLNEIINKNNKRK